jgi:hypothetical protein
MVKRVAKGEGEEANSVQVPLRVAPRTAEYLDDLIATGLYDTSRSAVARQLVLQGIQRAIADRHLEVRR